MYWIFVIAAFLTMRYHETKGHWPLMKAKQTTASSSTTPSETRSNHSEEAKGQPAGGDEKKPLPETAERRVAPTAT